MHCVSLVRMQRLPVMTRTLQSCWAQHCLGWVQEGWQHGSSLYHPVLWPSVGLPGGDLLMSISPNLPKSGVPPGAHVTCPRWDCMTAPLQQLFLGFEFQT